MQAQGRRARATTPGPIPSCDRNLRTGRVRRSFLDPFTEYCPDAILSARFCAGASSAAACLLCGHRCLHGCCARCGLRALAKDCMLTKLPDTCQALHVYGSPRGVAICAGDGCWYSADVGKSGGAVVEVEQEQMCVQAGARHQGLSLIHI